MLSDQAVARRERTKEKRTRREQRIQHKRSEFIGKHDDGVADDTQPGVQAAIQESVQQHQQQSSTKGGEHKK
ncbi:unnamed protein product [Didymodactylos carnosus]|uniref:Uncharacterized protein n=1 Tax=Didymodactylos carnosus TaxID=1234261 RepID=A0A816E7J4_9BILA|nr:unnamed protein product [Didymodactylos carnosus]CAF4557868.1 unnamed protein product [Didymodactylos carnosus]